MPPKWECNECGMVYSDEKPDFCSDCLGESFSQVGDGDFNGDAGSETSTQADLTGSSDEYGGSSQSLLSEPFVLIGVLIVIAIVAVGVFGIGGGIGDGNDYQGSIEATGDCEADSISSTQGEIECTHTVEVEGATVSSGTLVVKYKDGGEIIHEKEFDVSKMSDGDQKELQSSYTGDLDTIENIDIEYEFVNLDRYS